MKKIVMVCLLSCFCNCRGQYLNNDDSVLNLSDKNLSEKRANKVLIKRLKSDIELKTVDLSKNKLSRFPDQLFSFKSIEKLSIGYNQIDSIPDQISELENLTFLGLSSNPVTYISPEISKLKKLKYIMLYGGSYNEAEIEVIRKLFCKRVKIVIYSDIPNPFGLKECK